MDDGDSGMDLEARVEAVSDELFEAMGVTGSRVPYGYVRRAESSCAIELGIEAGLGEDQAWYARNTYRLGPGDYDEPALLASARERLVADGWEVEDYTGPGTLRTVLAVKDQFGVRVDIPQLGVTVSAGPCGRAVNQVGSQFTRVPG